MNLKKIVALFTAASLSVIACTAQSAEYCHDNIDTALHSGSAITSVMDAPESPFILGESGALTEKIQHCFSGEAFSVEGDVPSGTGTKHNNGLFVRRPNNGRQTLNDGPFSEDDKIKTTPSSFAGPS